QPAVPAPTLARREIRHLEGPCCRLQPQGYLMKNRGHLMKNRGRLMKRSCGILAGAVSAALIMLLCSGASVQAELRIDITSGKVEPMPIAIPVIPGAAANETQAGRDIAGVVSNDLERSGLFRPIDPRSFIQNVSLDESQPRFPDWRQINAQALVTGSVKTQGDGRLRVEFRLWDVLAEQQLTGYGY